MRKIVIVVSALCICLVMLSACTSPRVADHTQNWLEKEVNGGILMPESSTEITIGSYNLKAFGSIPPVDLAKTIDSKNIDIIGMQEVDNLTKRNPRDVLAEIADASTFDYDSTYFSNAINFEEGNYGLGIMSKYKFASADYKHYSPNYKLEDKLYQRVEFSIGSKTLAFYNTHLNYEEPDSIRESQIARIYEIMQDDTADYKVLVGDFNTENGVNELDVFNDGYKMISTVADPLITYPEAKGKKAHLDNIIVSDNIDIVEFGVVEGDSDHYMLYARISLK